MLPLCSTTGTIGQIPVPRSGARDEREYAYAERRYFGMISQLVIAVLRESGCDREQAYSQTVVRYPSYAIPEYKLSVSTFIDGETANCAMYRACV